MMRGASGPGGHFIKHVYLYITFFCRNFGGVAVSRATPGAGGGILEECFSSHGGSLNHLEETEKHFPGIRPLPLVLKGPLKLHV